MTHRIRTSALSAIVPLITTLISSSSHAQSWEPPPESPKRHTQYGTSNKENIRPRGFQSALLVGAQKYLGNAGEDFDPGIRLGGSLGFRFGEAFSLQGELAFDFENPSNSNSTPISFGLSLVPMFHFALGSGEIRMAPKFGMWRESVSSEVGGIKLEQSTKGTLLGANFALVFRAGDYFLGPMLMLEQVNLSEMCLKEDNFDANCRSATEISSNGGNLSVGIASLNFVLWL